MKICGSGGIACKCCRKGLSKQQMKRVLARNARRLSKRTCG